VHMTKLTFFNYLENRTKTRKMEDDIQLRAQSSLQTRKTHLSDLRPSHIGRSNLAGNRASMSDRAPSERRRVRRCIVAVFGSFTYDLE
jgi:hypothetical protein